MIIRLPGKKVTLPTKLASTLVTDSTTVKNKRKEKVTWSMVFCMVAEWAKLAL